MYIPVYTSGMTTKVSKWGNSYGIRIPKEIIKSLQITEDTEVNLIETKGKIEIEPIKQNKKESKYTLKELCDQITDENRHEVIDWGKPMGREVW